jgi:CheY-like chemotaxis protein
LTNIDPVPFDSGAHMLMDPIKVFIADDAAHVVEVLSELIEDGGRRTICGTAGTAREAIAAIRQTSPDVIVADLQLHEGTGFDVLDAIRTAPGDGIGSKPLIVLFSNHVGAELRRHAIAHGADHFLDKTCDHGRLLELIDERAAGRTG